MRLLFLFILVFLSSNVTGQVHKITIIVTDTLSNEPLPFANLYLKPSGSGAITNMEGIAHLDLGNESSSDSLVISYIGYQRKCISLKSYGTEPIRIALNPSDLQMPDVVIAYTKPPDPEKLILNSIKKTEENYTQKDDVLHCLYRETLQENDKYIQLNEAITNIYYTSYPQPKLDPDVWVAWDTDETYAFDLEGIKFSHFFLTEFNTKSDQQQIVASRYSSDLSETGAEVILMGDPLTMTALDKIKYQYDFLDPHLLNNYKFTYEGLNIINGATCHTISFYPKPTHKRFYLDWTEKPSSAIYIGRIFIEKESFAVTRFEYRLAVERDYDFFTDWVPLEFFVEVNYSKKGDLWFLESIRQIETKKIHVQKSQASILKTATRELFIMDVNDENATPFPDTSVYRSTKNSSIRCYYDHYNPDYWKSLVMPGKCALNPKISFDLEKKESLEAQFQSHIPQYQENLQPPVPGKKPFAFQYHDSLTADSLHWMANPKFEKEFISYLDSENAYAKNYLLPDRKYQQRLFNKLNTFYQSPSEPKGKPLPGSFFYETDSTGREIIFFQQDSVSRVEVFDPEEFQFKRQGIHIRRIIPNEHRNLLIIQYEKIGVIGDFALVCPFGERKILDSLSNVGSIEWNSDSSFVFAKTDPSGISSDLYQHVVATGKNSLLYSEADKTFSLDLDKQGSELFCMIQSKSGNEIYWISSISKIPGMHLVVKRKENVEYQIRASGEWYLHSNDRETRNKILVSDGSFPLKWTTAAVLDKKDYLLDFKVSKSHIITHVSENSFQKIKFVKKGGKGWTEVPFTSQTYSLFSFPGEEKTDTFIFSCSSPSRPDKVYKYDPGNNTMRLVNADVPQDSNSLRYVISERLWARSYDGVKVPITLIKDIAPIKHHQGLILRVYGAYGANTIPSFSAEDAILLHEGYAIAYAHVRGDNTLGDDWYDDGKLMNKKNSFYDYIACAKFLIKKKITSPEYLVAYGNSAGGLIVGWAINNYPELFNTAILDHAYLDVTNTMMNDSLPLTTDEYKEWGNPGNRDVFNYINSYSPYQNIKRQAYPNVIFIGSFQDFQTSIWQIAKHAALLREKNSGNSKILLLTDMNSGHSGNITGKEWIKLYSKIYSFVNLCLFEKPVFTNE